MRSLAFGLLSLLAAAEVVAQDKSSTRGSIVGLPNPGGTIQKETSGFKVQNNTGSANFDVPLPTLPGRGGVKTDLTLSYSQFTGDSGNGFGIGWSLNIPTMVLDTEFGTTVRFPKRDGDFYNPPLYNGETLILVKQEGNVLKFAQKRGAEWLDISYSKTPFTVKILDHDGRKQDVSIPSGFSVRHTDGTTEVFSGAADFAEGLPALGFVNRWPLVYKISPQGEAVEYRYQQFGGRSYLSEVIFAGGQSRYSFDLMDAKGTLVDYRNSFAQQNLKLYSGVKAEFRGKTVAQWCLAYVGRDLANANQQVVRSGDSCESLAQEELSGKIDTQSLNVLDQLRAIYRLGKTAELDHPDDRWPTIYLDYSSWTLRDLSNRPLVYKQDSLNFLRDKDKRAIELTDINHDAQVDVIYSSAFGEAAQAYLGKADLEDGYKTPTPWQLTMADGTKTNFSLIKPDTHFADINGDSYADLVKVYAGGFEVYLGDKAGQFQKYSKNVTINNLSPDLFEGGAAQFIDMDGDGFSDILAPLVNPDGTTGVAVYRNLSLRDYNGKPWISFDAPAKLRLPVLAQNVRFFANETVKVTDITGDGLPDLIVATTQAVTHKSGLCIYNNTGNLYDTKNFSSTQQHGLAFGDENLNDPICGPGKFLDLQNLNAQEANQGIRNMWALDVNGDGIIDFASAIGTPNKLRVWLGIGNAEFLKAPIELNLNLPIQVGTETNFRSRVADLDGDGQAEIMIFQADGVAVIDFNRAQSTQLVKANLLTSISYESGLRHDIRYTTSIDEIERDRLQQLPSSSLHFPVVLAKQVMTSEKEMNGERQQLQTEEYLFHQPDFDAVNKKFLGFAKVERIFYGDNLGGQTSTQASSLTIEDYVASSDVNGFTLRGQLKKQSIYSFTPHDSYLVGGKDSLNFSDARVYSLSAYSRTQKLPLKGTKKQEKTNTYDAPEGVGTATKKTYFIRRLSELTSVFEGPAQMDQQTNYTSYDAYNIPAIIRRWSGAAVEPTLAIRIPSRLVETQYAFDASRQQLGGLGIFNSPDREITRLIPGNDINSTSVGEVLTEKTFEYDGNTGFLVKHTEAVKNSAEPRTLVNTQTFDSFGNVLTIADTAGIQETVIWDEDGIFPIKGTNALGHEVQLTYGPDTPDQISSGRDAKGHEFTISYDNLGRSKRYTYNSGKEQLYSYKMARAGLDSMVLTQIRRYPDNVTPPVGEATWIKTLKTYTPSGTEVASVEENEQVGIRVLSLKEFNRNRQQIKEYSPYEWANIAIDDVFAAGKIPLDDNDRQVTKTFYDELGRPVRRVSHALLTETYSYPVWGEKVQSTYAKKGKADPTPSTTTKSTVRSGAIVFATIDELNQVTRFNRDSWLNLKSILLAGETEPRTMRINSKGWLESENIPGIGLWETSYGVRGEKLVEKRYDSQGLLLNTTVSSYDALQRLTQQTVDGKLALRQSYDTYPRGSRTRAVAGSVNVPTGLLTVAEKIDPNGLYNYVQVQNYDLAGRNLGQEVRIGNETYVDAYTYTLDDVIAAYQDPFGVRTVLTLSKSMRAISADLQAPWFSKAEPIFEHLSYNPRGQLERMDYRAGTSSWITYDTSTLLPEHLESVGKDGQKLQDLVYSFDGKGQLLQIADRLTDSPYGLVNRTANFSYNDRGELLTAERFGKTQTYGYNAAGNLNLNTELSPDAFRTTARTSILPEGTESTPFVFDAAGQLTSGRDILDARYDARGQMIYAKTARAEVYIGYSPNGKRIYRKTVPLDSAKAPLLSYYPMPSVIVESGLKQSFVMIGGQRLARLDHDKKEWFYYIRDHLNSSELMMSSDGVPVEQILYMPYGSELNPIQLSGVWQQHDASIGALKPSQTTKHRFTGHYRDDDLGVYDFGARHYDPYLGRFLTPDPAFIQAPEKCVKSPVECNLYSYAKNNPLINVDPDGFESQYSLHIVIEPPRAAAITPKNELNINVDTGHTFLYLVKDGMILGKMSFGPQPGGITSEWKFITYREKGNADWPTSGNAHDYKFDISEDQYKKGMRLFSETHADPGRYTPTRQCTSVAVDLAQKIGVKTPDGKGDVVYIDKKGRTWGPVGFQNPHALDEQLVKAGAKSTTVRGEDLEVGEAEPTGSTSTAVADEKKKSH